MTDREIVTGRHPDALAICSNDSVFITCVRPKLPFPNRVLGKGKTENEAWQVAAEWIKTRDELFDDSYQCLPPHVFE